MNKEHSLIDELLVLGPGAHTRSHLDNICNRA
jgi:hypothetical protein